MLSEVNELMDITECRSLVSLAANSGNDVESVAVLLLRLCPLSQLGLGSDVPRLKVFFSGFLDIGIGMDGGCSILRASTICLWISRCVQKGQTYLESSVDDGVCISEYGQVTLQISTRNFTSMSWWQLSKK